MSDRFGMREDGSTYKIDDLQEWAKAFQSIDRRIAQTKIGDMVVSTVFLGLDHSWDDTPLLFETLVFSGPLAGEMERYSTIDKAKAGHEAMCARVRATWS